MFILNSEHIFENLIQIEMKFDCNLDRQRLRRSLELILVKYPIAGCRFVEDKKKPYFETLPEVQEILRTGSAEEYHAFINEPVYPETGPLIHAFLDEAPDGDRFAIKASHVFCDVGGLKELTAAVAGIYRRLESDRSYVPAEVDGSRGFDQVFRQLPLLAYPKIFLNCLIEMKNLIVPRFTHTLPLKEVPLRPFEFIRKNIPAERVSGILSYGKKHDATLNDVFLAAFNKALLRFQILKPGCSVRTAFTVDHRIWSLKGSAENICSLSGFELIKIDTPFNGNLEETVAVINGIIRKRKSNFFGLNQALGVMLFSSIPYAWTKLIWSKLVPYGIRSGNTPSQISNYSSIDEEKLTFDRAPVKAWILTPIAMTPGFSPAFSSYRGEITVSAGVPMIPAEKAKIGLFLDLFIEELP